MRARIGIQRTCIGMQRIFTTDMQRTIVRAVRRTLDVRTKKKKKQNKKKTKMEERRKPIVVEFYPGGVCGRAPVFPRALT